MAGDGDAVSGIVHHSSAASGRDASAFAADGGERRYNA